MFALSTRSRIWLVIFALVVAGFAYSFWPRAVFVATYKVQSGPMEVGIFEEAKTRIHDVYTLSSPVDGYLRRIQVEVGDDVVRSVTRLVEVQPGDPTFLDERTEAQATAAVQSAKAAEDLALAEVSQAEAELEFAESELRRIKELSKQQSVSQREVDNAERQYKSLRATLATAQAGLQMRQFQHKQAEALLLSPIATQQNHGHCACLEITAPVSGKVLSIRQKSEGVIRAGSPLVDIGDPEDLEVVVELLSNDAVQVKPGLSVRLRNWGGEQPLSGIVERIEPVGFTKVSALGIREQRVNVIVQLRSDRTQWQNLGHAYQLDAEIILWQQDAVLQVPITALFRKNKQWAVYRIEQGRLKTQLVETGERNHHAMEILSGLAPGDMIVAHPNNQISDGVLAQAINP